MSPLLRLVVIGGAVLIFFGLPSLVTFYTDWLWFGETGYAQVFTTSVLARAGIGAAAWTLAFGWLAFNLRLALSTLRFAPAPVWSGQGGVSFELPGRRELQRLALGLSALVALPLAFYASNQWLAWLTFRHGGTFGTTDPILGYDVGFYLFTLPFVETVRGWLFVLVLLAIVGAAAIYVLARGLGIAPTGGLVLSRPAQRHLALLAALLFLLAGLGAWLSMPREMTTASGIVHGAAYADVSARFPVARALAGISVIGALLSVGAAVGRPLLLGLAVALYLVVSIGGELYAAAIQRFVVAPNEQVRERPYIQHNIAFTRRAFGLENVEERELSGDATLSPEDIRRNSATLRNVRLWDHRPLLETFGQLQEIRPYYDFVAVDNDRYTINGEFRQVMLSARELNSAALPNRSWINERLAFTHGYGITLGPVNLVTQEGLPVLFVRDLPPVSSVDLQVKEPSLYFGELSNDYVIARTRTREFDYPKGEDNVTTSYTGRGGIPVESALRKAAFAIRFRAQQIFFTDDITPESRVLFDRRIADRVRKIAPFLWYDEDPYLVVHDGRLFWIQDAYTYGTRYPYATPAVSGVNYVRNSVKVTIDAFHGTTTYYLADSADPIAATFGRIFPGLFRPLAEMPEGLRRHLRYPETLFAMQTAMYATYHMTNPAVFYGKEDQWEIPTLDDGRQAEPMQPYYTVMKLPGETKAEFIQMVPLTPRRKDNLAAWMVARSDGDHYGRLFVFRFPKQKVVFGPRQVIARINQDQVISPQITLWNQQGSEVIQGTLLVVPIEESLLYIRPLYLRAQGGRIPELKRVIVAYQNQIVMEPTLEGAIERLFGAGGAPRAAAEPAGAAPPPGAPQPEAAGPRTPATGDMAYAALAAQARDHYQRAIQAQRQGDWATYGEEIRRLGAVLEQMRDRR